MASLTASLPTESELVAAAAATVDYAFQPIISTSSLMVHGFEALARLTDPTYYDITDLLDSAHASGTLCQTEGALLSNAIGKFSTYSEVENYRLFCNLDNRVFDGRQSDRSLADALFGDAKLAFDHLCLELSERNHVTSQDHMIKLAELLSRKGAKIALDDFGVGVSTLQLLMTVKPHYVKIDRCFIDNVSASARKQAIVAKLCELSHSLGFFTVAEGVESESDFRTARDLGCDFAQGFHIAHPTQQMSELATAYGRTITASNAPVMAHRVADLLSGIEPLQLDNLLTVAADHFQQHPSLTLIPVVDRENIVQGAILEEDMRRYLLSDYGRSLLANKSAAPALGELVKRCAVAESFGSIESILNTYMAAESSHGMILIHDGRYVGYLTNHALLRLAYEREVSVAREQNPLTQLPGNQSINRQIGDILCRAGRTSLAFFDFDHFKSFNDVYGFAAGDRALLMFADLLREFACRINGFAGHIGGDDFFVSIDREEVEAEAIISELAANFAVSVSNLYSPADRERGGIVSIDRFGVQRFSPLLRASAGILHLPVARAHLSQEMIESQLSVAKQHAKKTDSGVFVTRLHESSVACQIAAVEQCMWQNPDRTYS